LPITAHITVGEVRTGIVAGAESGCLKHFAERDLIPVCRDWLGTGRRRTPAGQPLFCIGNGTLTLIVEVRPTTDFGGCHVKLGYQLAAPFQYQLYFRHFTLIPPGNTRDTDQGSVAFSCYLQ